MLNIRKVVVGVSGGVDSAVAALILKQKGYDVQGVFMQNWDIADEKGVCSADADYQDAAFVCNKLNIKLKHVNFVKQYWNEVFCELVREYENGGTPNPDILCNRNVKFHYFYKYALNELGADAIGTGHYARSSFGTFLQNYNPKVGARLYLAKDWKKDQTFFLCQIPQMALQKTMFPLGDLYKSEVKAIAIQNGLEKIAKKKESMGICFIGTRNFKDFIQEYVEDRPGPFIDVNSNKTIYSHSGIHQFTLGQRANIPGCLERQFIGKKDVETNTIFVVNGTKHPLLYSNLVFTSKPYWIHSQPEELKNGVLDCLFKFQHTKKWVKCLVYETRNGLVIKVDKYKRALTPGQFAVLSKNGECLGSAKIANSGVSYFSLNYFKNVGEILNKYNPTKETEEFTDNEDVQLAVR